MQESPPSFIYPKEERVNNDKPLEFSRFGGWLHRGKVLAPSTSVVLYRNLFACVYVNALLFSLWTFDWGDEKRIDFYLFLDSIKL